MRFAVLGSGSKGNCTLVESGTTRILIDAGFSGKELQARLHELGVDPADLSAILVTHEHDDHIRGVGVLARRLQLRVYGNEATWRAGENRLGAMPRRLEFQVGETFVLDGVQVHPFAVSHDAADPVGFVLDDGRGQLGYCTDTGTVTRLIRYHLQGCQGLILEANHDVDLLRAGPYPLPLQQRVLSQRGHLANGDALGLAAMLADGALRHLVLAHLSEVNNTPDLVRREARRLLADKTSLRLMLAEQARPCPWVEILP